MTTEAKSMLTRLDPAAVTLLKELRKECQNVVKLLAQLDLPTLREDQADALLGDLSAAILHLHEHPRGLEEMVEK